VTDPGNTDDLDEPTAFSYTPCVHGDGCACGDIRTNITLAPEAWTKFCELIENPPPPPPALVELMRRHRP
jgi:hypothetical protein